VANLSLPLLGFLIRAEGGIAVPGDGGRSEGALRAGIERGFGIGDLSAEAGLAWRRSFPGRNASEVAQLAGAVAAAVASNAQPIFAPFAPYWGSGYFEGTVSVEGGSNLSLSLGLVSVPDFSSLGFQISAEAWTGDLRFFVNASGSAGSSGSEFVAAALATHQSALEIEAGVGITF
jgi:hypothetical protein